MSAAASRRGRFARLRRPRRRGCAPVVAMALAISIMTGCVAAPPHPPDRSARFGRQLAIPPLDRGVRHGSHVTFTLRTQAGTTDFGRSAATRTWGINGSYLGPTLRAHRGDQVTVHVTNALRETVTMHWHGMHLPARMDGGPQQPITPAASWSPTWTVNQPAATLWYHPHQMGRTALQVYRGLAGMFILDDATSDQLPLPHRYGIDDIPVIVQDKLFRPDGQLQETPRGISNTGLLGNTILVNGTPAPYLPVSTQRIRLRLLNASNARIYNFGLDNNRPFDLISTDDGLLDAPAPMSRIQLAPGERAEIVVSTLPGERAVLRSYPPDLGAGPVADRLAGGDDSFDVLQLRAAERLAPSPAPPPHLATIDRLAADSATRTRTFTLDEDEINGRQMDMDRIDQTVHLGSAEIWAVTNHAGSPHTFHVHGTAFQVLDVNNRPPPVALRGWKDTVYIAPGATVRLILRFTDYADSRWPYMFHCHMLRHEDAGMMGQYLVVGPGAFHQPAPPPMPTMPDGMPRMSTRSSAAARTVSPAGAIMTRPHPSPTGRLGP